MAHKVSDIVDFLPFDKQIDPCLSTASITAVVTGARAGKTMFGAFRTAMEAIEQKYYDPKDIIAEVPYVIGVGAPTFPLLQRVVLPALINRVPDRLKAARYHETKKLLRVHGMSGQETHIYFISAKYVDSWYGLKLGWVWLDEFALVKEELFDELQTRLSDNNGAMLLTGTPQGPNWAHNRLYKPWQTGERDDIAFYNWTTMDNPYMMNTPAKQVAMEEKRRTMPKRYFDRTFLATWDTFEGQIYEDWLEAYHCRPRDQFVFRLPNGRTVGSGPTAVKLNAVIAGVDWGWAPGHAGVIIVMGKDPFGRWWLLEESVEEGVLVAAEPLVDCWVNRGRTLAVKWGIERFYCDSANPEHIQQFVRAGLPAGGSDKSVGPGIECVANYVHVDEGSIQHDDDYPMLVCMSDLNVTKDEFTYYHWKEGREEPDKCQDNCMDAIRYGIYTHETAGRFTREPEYAV